ncbi:hypothetical protein F2Q68_00026983 [Brassica cretica]|uniref:F-box domain-containing protein n=1 Tax=Brassica cretica TaxID=69181 RepID=A0A8S9ICI7_BRACR|nr:hypothetical protein F2Q68_00026983 [Brassica cretica]
MMSKQMAKINPDMLMRSDDQTAKIGASLSQSKRRKISTVGIKPNIPDLSVKPCYDSDEEQKGEITKTFQNLACLKSHDGCYVHHKLLSELEVEIFSHLPCFEYWKLQFLNKKFLQLLKSGEIFRVRQEKGLVKHYVILHSGAESNWEIFDKDFKTFQKLPKVPSSDYCFFQSDKETISVGTQLIVTGREIVGIVVFRYELENHMWFKGGIQKDDNGNPIVVRTVEKYNADTKSWTMINGMHKARKFSSGCFLRGKFYVLGGRDENDKHLTCGESYDETTNSLHTFPSSNLQNLSSSKSLVFNMSSSHGDKRSSDVEMGEATSPAPIPTSPVEAPACVADHLSFRERLVRRQAEKEQVRAGAELPSSYALAVALGHGTEGVTPRDTGTLAGSVTPDASALPAGSSMTPILVEDKERAADSMPPPPARKDIVLALRAPSVVPVAQPKGRKRKFTKGGDGEFSQQGDSSIASGLRGKFMSLIDGMISECGSETSRLTGELLELQGRWSETEAMLTTVKDSHSVKVSKLEVAIGELERDLGKTASSLLKEKKARKAKSSEVRRLQRQIEGDAGLASRGIREATDALRSEFQTRLAKISAFLGSLKCIRNRDLALATI